MIPGIRCTLVVIPFGLLLAGCASTPHQEYSSSGSTRIIGEPVASENSRDLSSDEVRISPRENSGSQFDITLDEIRGHLRDNSAVIIDARSSEDFARGHVRGAINVPAGQKEPSFSHIKKNYSTDQLIIIYCGSSQCHAGENVYDYALSQGFTNMRVFKPGWKALSAEKDLQ